MAFAFILAIAPSVLASQHSRKRDGERSPYNAAEHRQTLAFTGGAIQQLMTLYDRPAPLIPSFSHQGRRGFCANVCREPQPAGALHPRLTSRQAEQTPSLERSVCLSNVRRRLRDASSLPWRERAGVRGKQCQYEATGRWQTPTLHGRPMCTKQKPRRTPAMPALSAGAARRGGGRAWPGGPRAGSGSAPAGR